MERQGNGKVIAIVALLVAVVGLSLGFAAFSSTLTITSSADVPIDASVWNVGFSNTTNSIPASATVYGVTNSQNNGVLNITQFAITQGTNATLATTNGSKVEYEFNIVNTGQLAAYLNRMEIGSLTCTYAPTSSQAGSGGVSITPGTGTIDSSDCKALFKATLSINDNATATVTTDDVTTNKTSGFTTAAQIAKPASGSTTYVPAKLTIEYKTNGLDNVTTVPNGDFVVSLGTSTVVYGTSQN